MGTPGKRTSASCSRPMELLPSASISSTSRLLSLSTLPMRNPQRLRLLATELNLTALCSRSSSPVIKPVVPAVPHPARSVKPTLFSAETSASLPPKRPSAGSSASRVRSTLCASLPMPRLVVPRASATLNSPTLLTQQRRSQPSTEAILKEEHADLISQHPELLAQHSVAVVVALVVVAVVVAVVSVVVVAVASVAVVAVVTVVVDTECLACCANCACP